ncbi:MAG: GNAT family N-acetyltransferase [Planctomycetota bacterium]
MSTGINPPIDTDMLCGKETVSSTADKRRVRSPIIACTVSDHIALGHFLSEIFGARYPAEFQASLNDPFYAPDDRLLLRRMGRTIAHVHVTRRLMQFGSLALPVAGLQGLATANHCRRQGLGTHLLLAAERQMAQSGALIGLLRTRIPHFFRRTGWALCGGSSGCAASPHAVLVRLLEQGLSLRRASRIQVRPWRRWEEEAIARVYRQSLPGNYGLLQRSRPYWLWLLERRAYDQFYVALDGPDLWDFNESSTQFVGYAAIKREKIVELVTAPGRRKVAMELLARACGDAIEQDRRQISLLAPADSPLLEYFRGASESLTYRASDRAEFCMARLLDPLGLLKMMCGVFVQRATEAGLGRSLELGLLVDGQKYQIDTAGSGRAMANTMGRSFLRLNVANFTRMVLGQLDWDRALEEGLVVPSTSLALNAGRALFPPLPFWRPILDDCN